MELKKIKNILEEATVAVSTIKDNKPYAIAVLYVKVKDDKIIITDNYMRSTVENIRKNPYICLVFWKEQEGWRIEGKASYFNSGKWVEFVKSIEENKGEPLKGAIVIDINKITKLG
jgi:nitroimidazol reductase NimA-like FMN-containing flavoprotein (pyridoxamine 5'-phosphate oxidase superfamily)